MIADILAFGAHPDDIEMSCAGTLIKAARDGKTVVLADLTAGDLGTRGSAEERLVEASHAATIMGASSRVNLGFRDGFFENDEAHKLEVIKVIRQFKPKIVLSPAIDDRHPDHARAARLINDACFLSGLTKIQTELDGAPQVHHRPDRVFSYIQDRYIKPDFLIDISDVLEIKFETIRAYGTQFMAPQDGSPQTYISSDAFMNRLFARNLIFGKYIGTQYAEGFNCNRPIGAESIFNIL